MTINLGIIMDPISQVNYKKDSSLAMLLAAQQRGWQLYYMEQEDLFIQDATPMSTMRKLHVKHDPTQWYQLGIKETKPLSNLHVILMRKDPPVDQRYIYTTYMLSTAQKLGTLVVNSPQSLRNHNEKLFALDFPQCCVPTLVSSHAQQLKTFILDHKDVILKPLDGMGGHGIFRIQHQDPNANVVIETLSHMGAKPIIAQGYIPEITQGDKRILLIDGEPIPYALARVPSQGEHRGNLAAGGTGIAQALTDRDYWICEQIKPTLKANGLLFVGIDVIGDYLTEINITSPTCIRELDKECSLDIAGTLMDCIESKLSVANSDS